MAESENDIDDSDEQRDEPDTPTEEQPEAGGESDDLPPVGQDEMADIGSVAEEIEEATQKQQDEGDTSEDSEADDSDDPTEREVGPAEGDISLGTVYCNALGMSAAVARGRYGDLDGDDREQVADEYAQMAEQIDLDTYLDQWMREQGGMDELSPGEAVLLGTLMWGGMVMLSDPAMAENAVAGVRA